MQSVRHKFFATIQRHGGLELTIGGNGVPARPGEIVLMPADIPHALRAVDDTKMLLTMLRDAGKE